MPVAWLLPNGFVGIRNRSNAIYLKTENVLNGFKESFGKIKKKVFPSSFPKTPESQSNSLTDNSSVVRQHFNINLECFRTTIKENAARALRQNASLTKCGRKSYFRGDFLWRRAKSRHLIAFGGLFLYQEEVHESNLKVEKEFKIYSNVCENIKVLFPEYEHDKLLHNNEGYNIEDFELSLKRPAATNPFEVSFNAQLKQGSENTMDIDGYTVWEKNILSETINETKSDFLIRVLMNECKFSNYNNLMKRASGHLLCYRSDQFGSKMPPHPNIINIDSAFLDDVFPELYVSTGEKHNHFNDMQPEKALYLVSKKYSTTLSSYLEMYKEIDDTTTCILMLQLLEAVSHLQQYNITHRNITSENIFVEHDCDGFVKLVLGGFNFAVVGESVDDLVVPFAHQSLDSRVAGLCAAPEVARAKPGRKSVIDYRKTDAWQCGVIGYEILTGRKLFGLDGELNVCSYTAKDLPNLESLVVSTTLVRMLEMLVEVDPGKRISAIEGANMLHFDMFALPPSGDLSTDVKCRELHSWAVMHCAESLARKQENSVLFELCRCFYRRLKVKALYESFCVWMAIRCCK